MITKPGTPEDSARFERFVMFTIFKNEGGWNIFENDATGEYSKFGVSLQFLRGLRPKATKDDITSLTLDGAKSLYYEYFWRAEGLWRLADDALAFRMFDLGVNISPAVAIRLLQRALTGVAVDGLLGEKTAATANAAESISLLTLVKLNAAERYRAIAAKEPAHVGDLDGWLARLERAV